MQVNTSQIQSDWQSQGIVNPDAGMWQKHVSQSSTVSTSSDVAFAQSIAKTLQTLLSCCLLSKTFSTVHAFSTSVAGYLKEEKKLLKGKTPIGWNNPLAKKPTLQSGDD